jgi:hypothetical protein
MAVSVGGLAFWVVALVDCVRRPEIVYRVTGTEKVTWVLIVALAGWIGGLIHWCSQRARLQEIERTGIAAFAPTYVAPYPGSASGPPGTPPGWYQSRLQNDGRGITAAVIFPPHLLGHSTVPVPPVAGRRVRSRPSTGTRRDAAVPGSIASTHELRLERAEKRRPGVRCRGAARLAWMP